MSKATVLVTGVTGYVGSHVVDQLTQRNYVVRGTVRNSKDEKKIEFIKKINPNIQLFDADLLKPGSFDEAAKGADYILHVASPFILSVRDPQTELIDPAVNGTLEVLEAAKKSGSVKRVVITSSVAALHSHPDDNGLDYVFNEKDWNTKSSLIDNPYAYSKVLAEKAAWSWIEKEENKGKFDIVTILPSVIVGPLFSLPLSSSVTIMRDVVSGAYPGAPRLAFDFVDVRDVATAHILAMEEKAASGRYVVNGGAHELIDICKMMTPHFPAYSIPQRILPNFFVYVAAIFDSRLTFSFLNHNLSQKVKFDHSRVQKELNLQFTPIEKSLVDCINTLIDLKVVPDKRITK